MGWQNIDFVLEIMPIHIALYSLFSSFSVIRLSFINFFFFSHPYPDYLIRILLEFLDRALDRARLVVVLQAATKDDSELALAEKLEHLA